MTFTSISPETGRPDDAEALSHKVADFSDKIMLKSKTLERYQIQPEAMAHQQAGVGEL
jgi:hypothetical protein